mmetsp:Transcript_78877/g.124473  ORF Transcript_78877/g.124473 Transcript_78877/m.124473 type:complete len:260 (+) Transcript_78877:49-828(+)
MSLASFLAAAMGAASVAVALPGTLGALAGVATFTALASGGAIAADALRTTLQALAVASTFLLTEQGSGTFEAALVTLTALGTSGTSALLVGCHGLASWLIDVEAFIAGGTMICLRSLALLHAALALRTRARRASPSRTAAIVEGRPDLGSHGTKITCVAFASADDVVSSGVVRTLCSCALSTIALRSGCDDTSEARLAGAALHHIGACGMCRTLHGSAAGGVKGRSGAGGDAANETILASTSAWHINSLGILWACDSIA